MSEFQKLSGPNQIFGPHIRNFKTEWTETTEWIEPKLQHPFISGFSVVKMCVRAKGVDHIKVLVNTCLDLNFSSVLAIFGEK